MKKMIIDPGICGFVAEVTAEMAGKREVKLTISTGCPDVSGITENLGDTFRAWDIVLKKPGEGPLYDYAREHLPHAACPVVAGLIKCIEAESKMALPKDVSFTFIDPE